MHCTSLSLSLKKSIFTVPLLTTISIFSFHFVAVIIWSTRGRGLVPSKLNVKKELTDRYVT